MLREIDTSVITDAVAELCIKANKILPPDITEKIKTETEKETRLARTIMEDIRRNADEAIRLDIPVCQDTGMAVVFAEIGQDVHLKGGSFEQAVNLGVKKGYEKGLLRKSVVKDPLRRVNTEDNTPAIIHTKIVEGDKITLTVAPKGFGSENMSGIRMLTPAAGRQGVIDAVIEIIKTAGSNPCPPMVIGVGIGGDFEQVAFLSKKALCRSINQPNSDPYYNELEEELLKK